MPAACEDRRIPMGDLEDDAQGLAFGIVQVARGHGDDFAMYLVRPAAIIGEHLGHFRHLNAAIADRFSGHQSFDCGEGFRVGKHRARNVLHHQPTRST